MAPTCIIADDEAPMRKVISRTLATYGVHATEVGSAQDLLRMLEIQRSPLIFLDVSLEGSDAIDAIRGLADSRFTGTVQLISGHRAPVLEDIKRVGEWYGLHMRSPIAKPFRAEAIRAVLRDENLASTEASQRPVALGEAIGQNWLELWYQPKIDLRTRLLAGAEGLIRVRHPEYGVVGPDAFLEAASGHEMMQLAEIVLITALRDWTQFSQAGLNLKLSINISVDLLKVLPIPALVREHRPSEAGWPGLILDVPESEVLRDVQLVHEAATQLQLYKIGLAIDDFRSGYPNMATLRAIPFEELKFDRGFFLDSRSDKQKNIGVGITHLMHRLGRSVVAEGLESPGEFRTLLQMGCDFGQGYLLSPALPRDQLITTAVGRARRAASHV